MANKLLPAGKEAFKVSIMAPWHYSMLVLYDFGFTTSSRLLMLSFNRKSYNFTFSLVTLSQDILAMAEHANILMELLKTLIKLYFLHTILL